MVRWDRTAPDAVWRCVRLDCVSGCHGDCLADRKIWYCLNCLHPERAAITFMQWITANIRRFLLSEHCQWSTSPTNLPVMRQASQQYLRTGLSTYIRANLNEKDLLGCGQAINIAMQAAPTNVEFLDISRILRSFGQKGSWRKTQKSW